MYIKLVPLTELLQGFHVTLQFNNLESLVKAIQTKEFVYYCDFHRLKHLRILDET